MKSHTLPATSYAQALQVWHAALAAAGMPERLEAETISLRDAIGRLPVEIVRTKFPAPSHAAAAMDGYAVLAARLVDASDAKPLRLRVDVETIAVDTGSALPPGCDAIVPVENAERRELEVLFSAPVAVGKHVRLAGEDVPPGVAVGRPGQALRPLDCAVLIAGGVARVAVVRRPRVTIIPTGNELMPPGADPAPGNAFESNSTMIAGAAQLLGAQTRITPLLKDDAALLEAALRSACARSDLVLVLGGSSRGGRDVSFAALSAAGTVAVRGVATRPAKPVNLGFVGATPVINLPGYPVASHVAFQLYAGPLLRRLAGYNEETVHQISLTQAVNAPGDADEWHAINVLPPLASSAGVVSDEASTSGLYASSQSDALLHVAQGQTRVPAGASAPAHLLRSPLDVAEPLFNGPYDPLIEELAALLHFRCRWTAADGVTALEPRIFPLAGFTAADETKIRQTLEHNPQIEYKALGRRIEGVAVPARRGSRNGELTADAQSNALESADAWSGAAAVAAGLASAAYCSAYVCRQFGLELIESRAIWYIMLWQKKLEREKQWSANLAKALRELSPNVQRLGWERVEESTQ